MLAAPSLSLRGFPVAVLVVAARVAAGPVRADRDVVQARGWAAIQFVHAVLLIASLAVFLAVARNLGPQDRVLVRVLIRVSTFALMVACQAGPCYV